MRKITQLQSIGALAGIAMVLGTGAAGAQQLDAASDLHVVASAVVPVNTPSASLAVRPTTVGPVKHDGQLFNLPAMSAAIPVSVEVRLHAEATGGGTVVVTNSNPATAVTVTDSRNDEGQRCIGLGVDFSADVSVAVGPGLYGGTTANADVAVTVMVGDVIAFSYETRDIALNDGEPVLPAGHHESIPVVTGADMCLPAEATVPLDTTVRTAADVVGRVGIG